MELLEGPPDGVHVLGGVGDVGVLEVEPEADPLGHALPLALVLPDRLLAGVDELLDAVGFYVLLALGPDDLLDLDLDGEAVRVPARLPRHGEAVHGLVARPEVLHDTRQDVARVGHSVRRRRPLVEDEGLAVRRAAKRLLEDLLPAPGLEDLLLALARRPRGRQRLERVGGHGKGHSRGDGS